MQGIIFQYTRRQKKKKIYEFKRHTPSSELYTIPSELYTIPSELYTIQSELYTIPSELYTIPTDPNSTSCKIKNQFPEPTFNIFNIRSPSICLQSVKYLHPFYNKHNSVTPTQQCSPQYGGTLPALHTFLVSLSKFFHRRSRLHAERVTYPKYNT